MGSFVPPCHASCTLLAMPWRICGKVIAGGQFFPPSGCSPQTPCGQERKRLLLPTPPMPPLIVRPPRCALAPLETCFKAMGGFGHPGQCPQGRLWHRIGPRIGHRHHRVLVAVTVAYPPQRLRRTWLTPMGSGATPALHRLHHQGTLPASAPGAPLPGCCTPRLTPGLDAVPGTLAWASPAARPRGRCCQVTPRRVRRYRHQVPLTPRCQPTPTPRRTPQRVVTGQPALGQRGTVVGQQLPGPLVSVR